MGDNQNMKGWIYLLAGMVGMFFLFVTPFKIQAGGSGGWALYFDGTTDFVELPYTSEMFPPGWQSTKTVSLWVKPEGEPVNCEGPGACDVIFGDRPFWWGIQRGVLNGQDRIWVWNAATLPDNSYTIHTIAIPYTPGEWVHIALVHQGGMLTTYKNGVFAGSVASGDTRQPDNPAQMPWLHIGGVIPNEHRNHTFRGTIDEVRLYSIALTQQQIIDTIATELTPPVTGLVAYYKMSDGAGTILTDDSGNGWHGVLKDGTLFVPGNGTLPQWLSSNLGEYFILPTPTPSPSATATEQPTIAPSPTGLPTQPGPSAEEHSVFLPLVKK